ncbi:hypothetical protein M7I_8330 [Glarea lozoyensis 74030]|uniref:Uncharacterized protein n=1 Tax=Glarea lozoyensis (strain ATCC 74030 / MF5533) TaxID=1104152 RepID=H0EZQ3_GLAL7|nr:hypothetical protein M7I_8330 [Glarea lozoyensis 74030]
MVAGGLLVPFCSETFHGRQNMGSERKFVDSVFHILQYLRLIREHFRPIRIQVETEGVQRVQTYHPGAPNILVVNQIPPQISIFGPRPSPAK